MSAHSGPRHPARPRSGTTIDERFQLSGLVEFLRHKEIPLGGHSTVWYYFGGVSLFFFIVQIVTGILLLMNYQVGENTSYESMKYLVGHVPFGWLVRSIHCWSAHLMSLAVLVHLFSVLFVKAYRKPRELTWYTGFVMFGLVLGFGFSGYLLPWNELSYFATAVGTDSVKSVPLVGPWLLRVLRGGEEVSVQTLYRFFALHVCILPLVHRGPHRRPPPLRPAAGNGRAARPRRRGARGKRDALLPELRPPGPPPLGPLSEPPRDPRRRPPLRARHSGDGVGARETRRTR